MTHETTFAAIPEGVIFWHAWDGVKDGQQVYAPRCYVRTSGRVRELREFGGAWNPEDAGFSFSSPVRTYFQPLTTADSARAETALRRHIAA